MIGEKLGKVDGVACVHAKREKAEERQNKEKLLIGLRPIASDGDNEECPDVTEYKCLAATQTGAKRAKCKQADARARSLDDTIGKLGFLRRLLGSMTFGHQHILGQALGSNAHGPKTG